MGYETRLYIGSIHPNSFATRKEIMEDKTKPYKDGSGYEDMKNDDGSPVFTGRIEKCLQLYATLDLCKVGEHGPLLDLLYSIPRISYQDCKEFVYVFDTDGNTKIISDKCDEIMKCFPLTTFLAALNKHMENPDDASYRRFKWCKALLESMKDDREIADLYVLTYGH